MKIRIIIISFLIFLITSCSEPENSYCSVTYINAELTESPNLTVVLEHNLLDVNCNFGGVDLYDTIFELTTEEVSMFWSEIKTTNLKSYYKDGPEWQTKRTNEIDFANPKTNIFKSFIIKKDSNIEKIFNEAMQRANRIELNSSVPQITSNELNLDSLREE